MKIESDNTMRVRCEGAKLSIADGKMVVTLSNLDGAYCIMCTRDQSECQKESVIETGFLINRSVQSITDLALSLTDHDSGDIIKEKGDYRSRMGVCGKPLTKSDLAKNIPVCNSKIRVFEFVIELLNRYLSHKKRWTLVNKVKYTTEEQEQYNLVRAKLKEDLYKKLAINMGDPEDMVTGAAFQIFSSDSSRKFLCGLIEENKHEFFSQTLLGLCTLVKVINSEKREVNVEKVRILGQQTYLQLVNCFPWVVVSPLVHQILAHSWEIIHMTDSFGLGGLSEDGLEALN